MVTTVTDNSPQAINTSLFSLERVINELDKKTMSALGSLSKGLTKIDNINLDNLTQNGIYYSLGEDNITNKPDDSMHNNIIEVVSQGNELVVQTFMYLVENEIYVRNKLNSGSWTDWVVVSNNATSVVISVNGKQGIVNLDASDVGALPDSTVIPAAQVNSDWNASSGVARILNKPSLATVATSGNYNDLSNKPTIPTSTSQLTNDSGFVSPQNVLFNDADVPEGSGNLSTTATAHKITTYRNGLTIPYQMDNTNDGGLLRVRGTSEDNCVLELGTWDDSGDGETIQFNYYPTTSKDTPTHSVSVPKKSGTIALTSDVPTKTSQLTNDSDFVTSSGRVANATYADTFRATYSSSISPAQAAAMTEGNRSWPLGYGKDYLQSVTVTWEDYGSHNFPAGAAGYFFPGYGSNGGTLVLVNYPSNRMLYNVWIDSNRWSGWHYVDLNPITYS